MWNHLFWINKNLLAINTSHRCRVLIPTPSKTT